MLTFDRSLAEEIGFNPYYMVVDKNHYIDMASNNYLGIAEDGRLKQAAIGAIERYGVSMCATPVATGYIGLFKKTEKRLSEFIGLDDTIIFPSCYQANNGIFSVLAGKDDLILIDRYAHSSLMQGVMSSYSKINPFLHNDMDHLEKVLSRSREYHDKHIFVVTESVFSTEGSIAPVDEITQLCDQYGAVPVIDDSHGIGVLGKTGGGVLEHFGIKDYKGIYTASLGKALANCGGMVSGKQETIEYLRHYCPQLIYSTAVTPATLGGINGALDVIEKDFGLLGQKMWRYKEQMDKSLPELLPSKTPIHAVATNSAAQTLRFAKRLFERGILSTPFIEPSVPKNQCVVRLIAGAGLTDEQVYHAAYAIKECL